MLTSPTPRSSPRTIQIRISGPRQYMRWAAAPSPSSSRPPRAPSGRPSAVNRTGRSGLGRVARHLLFCRRERHAVLERVQERPRGVRPRQALCAAQTAVPLPLGVHAAAAADAGAAAANIAVATVNFSTRAAHATSTSTPPSFPRCTCKCFGLPSSRCQFRMTRDARPSATHTVYTMWSTARGSSSPPASVGFQPTSGLEGQRR